MKKYLVTYDLVGTEETSSDYEHLIKRIKGYPWWGKIQKSVWILKTNDSAAEIRDSLKASMDANDRLFVAGLTGETAWARVICDESKLKTALTTQ